MFVQKVQVKLLAMLESIFFAKVLQKKKKKRLKKISNLYGDFETLFYIETPFHAPHPPPTLWDGNFHPLLYKDNYVPALPSLHLN